MALDDGGGAIAVGSSERGGIVATSSNARDWVLVTDDPAFDGVRLTSVLATEMGFIAGGVDEDRAAVWISSPAGEWRRVTLPRTESGIDSVAAMAVDGDRIVAVGSGAWFSDDGDTWELAATVPTEAAGGALAGRLHFSPVGCGGSLATVEATGLGFVAAGTVGCDARVTIWRSPDGETWDSEEPEAFADATVSDVAEIDGRLVALGAARGAAAAWALTERGWDALEALEAPGGSAIHAVVPLQGGYAAVIDGDPWRSSDGASWRPVSSGAGGGVARDLAARGGRAAAVGVGNGRPVVWLTPPDQAARLSVPRAPEPGEVGGSWSGRSPLPVAGFVTAVTGPDGLIYVFGSGTEQDGAVLQVTQVYDAAADSWQVRPWRTGPSAGPPVAVLHRQRIVLIEQTQAGARAVEYDPEGGGSVQIVPPLTDFLPTRAASVAGGVLAAGFDSTRGESTLWLLSDDEPKWSRLATPPAPVDGLVSGSASTVYALAGSRMWTYDVEADAWTPLARKPTPRGEFAMLRDRDGWIWVIGGFTEGDPDAAVEAYDPAVNRWFRGPDLPTPRMYPAGAVAPNGALVVVGGVTRMASEPDPVVEALRP